MPRVVITGIGCITPMGAGLAAFRAGLEAGRDAIAPLDLFDVTDFRSGVASRVGAIPRPAGVPLASWRRLDRCDRMALFAVDEALRSAGPVRLDDAALCCGLSTAGMFEAEQVLYGEPERGLAAVGLRRMLDAVVCSTTDVLLRHVGSHGPVITTSTACSSAANAIGQALDLIRDGDAEVALAGGADALCRLTLAGFNSLGVVAPDRPRPFDARRSGMVLGEGAAFLLLESEEHLVARGGTPELELAGYASTAEGHHIVHPVDTGDGALRAMSWALADAGVDAGSVDHVNAHGTATIQNDVMESAAIRRLLEDRTDRVPVTATKSLVGHSLGASGAIEAVASLLTLRHGFVAPTAGYAEPDPDCSVDVVHGDARRGRYRTVLSNSFAFGGNDVSLVFRGWGTP
ncbi:MAG: beta-ketoacyl-[acyl-carrier-protein] synthase family protein [Myxococcota bacterium]|jgi:3-oxoacyl-[acyl-carrier-protein] synthase II|nr:beta-ketoacyl-[acyl-carrier-protein] synthase family protein [Myxococcota bacterium]